MDVPGCLVSLLSLLGLRVDLEVQPRGQAGVLASLVVLRGRPHAKRWLLAGVPLVSAGGGSVLARLALPERLDHAAARVCTLRSVPCRSGCSHTHHPLGLDRAQVSGQNSAARAPRKKRLLPLLLETSFPAALMLSSIVVAWGWLCLGSGATVHSCAIVP